MKRLMLFFLFITLIYSMAAAQRVQIKNVAVVETQIDKASGAADEMTTAEVREITAEIRRIAVNSLPRNRYNVMTTETVHSMGDAVVGECAEENCVIILGSKIGADYIVLGTISKFRQNFSLTVEIFETDYGMLVASADAVRSANLEDLLEKASIACADMYKKFMETSAIRIIPATAPEPEPEPAALPSAAEPPLAPPVSSSKKQKTSSRSPAQTHSQPAQPGAVYYHSAQLNQNFTSGERLVTWAYNYLTFGFGAGSFSIMKDRRGGWTQVGLNATGILLLIVGLSIDDFGTTKSDAGVAFGISGVTLWGGNILVYNTYRSMTYKKPVPQTASIADTGLRFAVFPDENGGLKMAALYSLEF